MLEIRFVLPRTLLFCFLLITSCGGTPAKKAPSERAQAKQVQESMRLAKPPETLADDLTLEGLGTGIRENIESLNRLETDSLRFGDRSVKKDDYVAALAFLAEQIESGISEKGFIRIVKSNFNFYEVYGKDKWGEVLITSYYHPVIPGSRTKTPEFSQALYSVPPDLVNVRLDEFVKNNRTLSPIKKEVTDQPSELGILRGRLAPSSWGGVSNIVPYYTRQEIENRQLLEGQGLELAWVDPIDAFFLHIQGSGTVMFSHREEIRLGFAGKNGHPFVAISKYVVDEIPKEEVSMQAIKSYLRSLPEHEMREILNKNPSYIFFRELEGKPVTSLGAEVVAGRTIATDKDFFPKGVLAYMEFSQPVFLDVSSDEKSGGNPVNPSRWEPTSRFVLDQDTGSAIQGTYRVDLFWGSGDGAARHAGVMKGWGRLYYLVPQKEFLQNILKD